MRVSACLLGVAAVMLLVPAFAGADTSSTVSVVGTADISDSGLSQNVLQPQFKAAFPQYTLKFTGSAPTTAVANAENGAGGPSVLIVHDTALENQFVAGEYSYNDQPGSAIFTSDYVVAGPTADASHADIAANASHNVAQAFADIASAGVAGKATFIARGGTSTASSTTVEEHAIWALVNGSGLTPSGVVLCTVSAADGGGMSPIAPAVQSTPGQECPESGTVTSASTPGWYQIDNTGQAASMVATSTCALGSSGANSCYALTDRGTFDYLSSGDDPAGTIPNLTILTRDNDALAPGGATELVNDFHAYVVNPSSPGETVNLQGAQDLVSFLTSSALQSQLKIYLDTAGDLAGAPFKSDASPTVSSTPSTGSVLAGQPLAVTGSVVNNEPGYAVLASEPVSVDLLSGSLSTPVGSGATDANGNYSLVFTPPASGAYQVTTGQISQIGNIGLDPFSNDLLSPAAATPFPVTVMSTSAITSVSTPSTNTPAGRTASMTVGFKKVTVKNGSVVVSGVLSLGPATSGAMVRLFALRTGKVSKGKTGAKKSISSAVETKAPTFAQVAKVTIEIASKTFTIKHKFKRGFRYALQLEYTHAGQISTDSKYKYIEVR